ncbi:MAG: aminomethyl-transferring glycine dehydrogenase subunit GcvPA [Methanobacteriota archaeon]|nr:MAG: aminomethyl-transferring glycine dehydrogenase subunit GcvPA [Euryarchaeota archaeon]|tara:strand:- start:4107 stop:5477 length:1371 start_codon:yes stop_codon:yes gene_type:complete
MDQLPNLGRENEMLSLMGMNSIEDLFSDIPENVRYEGKLPLRAPQSEEEILYDAENLLNSNITSKDKISFLGAGLYRNYVPSLVGQLIGRGEFLTSYTPYQPEVSQGMLQAMWEFQTMVSELTGLPISNVSVYDISTAAAEAITCSVRVHNKKATQKDTVYVSELIPPDRLSVIENYTMGGGICIKKLKHSENGLIDIEGIKNASGSCAVYLEQPNPLGILDEGITEIKQIIGQNTALIIGVNPTSLGVLEAPGNYGADIVVGEGQPLGVGMTAGGPIYGIFACSKAYLRQMPGRIVGKSNDDKGRVAFCLTLSTREQHIRRHRATSNLCTNETLIALMGAMHMSLLGPKGIEKLGLRNFAARQLLQQELSEVEGLEMPYAMNNHYNEFVIKLPHDSKTVLDWLDEQGVIGGLALSEWYENSENEILVCATDQTTSREIEIFRNKLEEFLEVNSNE